MSPTAAARLLRCDQVFKSAAAQRNSRSGFANRCPVRAASSCSPWTVIVISAAMPLSVANAQAPINTPPRGHLLPRAGPRTGPVRRMEAMEQNTDTDDLRTFAIGGDLPVRRIGFGAMRLAQ